MTTKRYRIVQGLIIVLCFLFYGNSISNGHSIDDNLVNYHNKKVAKGIKAIPSIFMSRYVENSDQNFGYRPVTLSVFAIEHQLFGSNPHISHVINILLYAITCLVLLALFRSLLKKYHWSLPLFIVGVFLIHPIHSEVVNNIKCRDELLSFLFAILALKSSLKYVDSKKILYLLLAIVLLVTSLLAKMSSLTFIAIIPFTLYFFRKINWKQIVFSAIGLVALYKGVRLGIKRLLSNSDSEVSRELLFMENPLFTSSESFFELIPMACYTIGYYIKLLVAPYPLVFYYGYNKVPIVGWESSIGWICVVLIGLLSIFVLLKLKTKNVFIFGIGYFLITISMFSNLVKPAVGIIAERFAYIPSLGFCIVVAYGVFSLYKKAFVTNGSKAYKSVFLLASSLVVLTSCLYIMDRNKDWEDEITLTSNDIRHLENSVKANSLLADYLLLKSQKAETLEERKKVGGKAIFYYKQSLKQLPNFKKAHNNLGVLYNEKGDYKNAVFHAKKGIEQGNVTANNYYNLGVAYQYNGETQNGIESYQKSISLDRNFLQSYSQLAQLFYAEKEYTKALEVSTQMALNFPNKKQEILHQGQQIANNGFGEGSPVFVEMLYQNSVITQDQYLQFKTDLAQLINK